MLSLDVLKKIRLIEIETRRLLSGSFVGDYSSAKKGSGFEFDQIRDYQVGDDVRFIDWKSSARTGKLLVKQYIEERNRAVIIAVDVSASQFYGSLKKTKEDLAKEIAAVLALVADYGKDKASLILFTDEVEVFLPPQAGRKNIHKIMEKLFSYKPKSSKTDFACVLDLLLKLNRRDSIVILISDFIADIPEKKVAIVSKLYDLVAIRCLDKNEKEFPVSGFLNIEDLETGNNFCIDSRRIGAKKLNCLIHERDFGQESIFKKFGIDMLDLCIGKNGKQYSGQEHISDLILFFRRRMMY